MKVSYQWLQEYLDLDVAPQDLAEKIARTSVDINDVYSLSDGLKKIVVGEVVKCENHPDSDIFMFVKLMLVKKNRSRLFVVPRTFKKVKR